LLRAGHDAGFAIITEETCLYLPRYHEIRKTQMRVYVMCDQEGTSGMVHFENRDDTDPWNTWFRQRIMKLQTAELQTAIDGLVDAGATDIVVNDSHGSGYNILFERLRGPVRVIHGNPDHAEFWMSRLDDSFDAGCYLGGHPMEGTEIGILPHTRWELNGTPVGEVGTAMALFGFFGVPTVMVSGDRAVEAEVKALCEQTEVAVVKEALAPDIAIEHLPVNARKMIYRAAYTGLTRLSEIPPVRFEPPYHLVHGSGREYVGDDLYQAVFELCTSTNYNWGRKLRREGRAWVPDPEQGQG
jgi:D-amino peptidase